MARSHQRKRENFDPGPADGATAEMRDALNSAARSVFLAAVAVLAAVLIASCVPDGPQGEVPTHPTERFSVRLAWNAPQVTANGDSLTDLAAFRLYHSPSNPPDGPDATVIELGLETEYTVRDLAAGVHYFAVTALDEVGNESDLSESLRVDAGSP